MKRRYFKCNKCLRDTYTDDESIKEKRIICKECGSKMSFSWEEEISESHNKKGGGKMEVFFNNGEREVFEKADIDVCEESDSFYQIRDSGDNTIAEINISSIRMIKWE